MSLGNSQYDTLMRYYQQLQLKNKHQQDLRIAEAYGKIPRLEEIDRAIASISIKKARLLLGEDSGDDFDLKEQIHLLSMERIALLEANGFPTDYLEMKYTCPLCKDTGYIGNDKCICFKKAISQHLYTQSNIQDLLSSSSFDNFSLDYYSTEEKNEATGLTARQTAERTLSIAKDFVVQFDKEFKNLFFYGDTGVGKTFLSCCIARQLLDTTHSVIYYSAFDLFEAFADKTFSNSTESQAKHDYILDCDLLIIDDLGTELTNNFVASQFFLCINERILRRKSTIISTNLSLGNFMERYSERVFSRVSSNYIMCKLIGNDIRIQKKLLGGKQNGSEHNQ